MHKNSLNNKLVLNGWSIFVLTLYIFLNLKMISDFSKSDFCSSIDVLRSSNSSNLSIVFISSFTISGSNLIFF